MQHHLTALSILDGRNATQVEELSAYFSEYAFMQYRIRVEVAYLLFLSQKAKLFRKLTAKEMVLLNNLWRDFSVHDAQKIKEIEQTTKHDLKAIEYFIRSKLVKTTLADVIPFIHFGLTSYDITICAYGLMLIESREQVLIPRLLRLLKELRELVKKSKNMSMLGRTHGQPAVPTTMGKELSVFFARIKQELAILNTVEVEGKLNGAVGNFNALAFVYPDRNWLSLSSQFIKSLGLTPQLITTQILPYDSWLRLFDSMKRLNNIFLNFVQDVWWYISLGYFVQQNKKGEVGSSTMSHKINPIMFENAEGNLQVANNLLELFVRKLAVSRLQRDLSDSTVKRDFGIAFGFTLLAWKSIEAGLGRIAPDSIAMEKDLDNHWEVFSEGIQTYLRSIGRTDAYELMMEKTRGQTFTKEQFHLLIEQLPIDKLDKKKLKINTLAEYQGLALTIANTVLE